MHPVLPLPYALSSASTPLRGEASPSIIFCPCGTSGAPHPRRPAVAAVATATVAAAAAARTFTASALAAVTAAFAVATATLCPSLALALGLLGRRFRRGRAAVDDAAASLPTTGFHSVLSASARCARANNVQYGGGGTGFQDVSINKTAQGDVRGDSGSSRHWDERQ